MNDRNQSGEKLTEALRKNYSAILNRGQVRGERSEATCVSKEHCTWAMVDHGLPLVQAALEVSVLKSPWQECKSSLDRVCNKPSHLLYHQLCGWQAYTHGTYVQQ